MNTAFRCALDVDTARDASLSPARSWERPEQRDERSFSNDTGERRPADVVHRYTNVSDN